MSNKDLDNLDKNILTAITANARIPFLEIARDNDVSGAAIHQRVTRLQKLGVLKGSEFLLDPEKIGFDTCAYIGLYLNDPTSSRKVVEALKEVPEVVECYYTTGQYDLLIKVYARNNKNLMQIIHNSLQPLGLARTETLMCFQEAFRKKLPIEI